MGIIGMSFQQARIEQGYTLGEVADALNIDVRYIFDLEDEDFDDLPGKTFVIGYAKSYARFLGLNSKRITAAITAEIGYTDIVPIHDGVERQLLGSEGHVSSRRKEMQNFTKRSKKNRKYMVGIVFVLMLLMLISFLGTRLWI
ncbi:MAG: helix-turn-helix domain-containing protein [Clostridiales bacterium]